jgi:hypothetical protein
MSSRNRYAPPWLGEITSEQRANALAQYLNERAAMTLERLVDALFEQAPADVAAHIGRQMAFHALKQVSAPPLNLATHIEQAIDDAVSRVAFEPPAPAGGLLDQPPDILQAVKATAVMLAVVETDATPDVVPTLADHALLTQVSSGFEVSELGRRLMERAHELEPDSKPETPREFAPDQKAWARDNDEVQF